MINKNCITLILSLVLFISCKKNYDNAGNTNGGISQKVISIKGNAFIPNNVSVKLGTVVKWVNNDNVPHTATSDNGETFDSDVIGSGETFSYTTKQVGVFTYHCDLHPAMTAILTVNP